MSRIELHCPSCGYDVPMTLMTPPKMFECPECQEVMPRDKLTRLKVLHRHIAGAPPGSPFGITNLGTFSGGDGVTTVFTAQTTTTVVQGELFVACFGNSSGVTTGTTMKLGAADNLTVDIETAGLSVNAGIGHFGGTITTPGVQTLTITFASAPTDFCVAMLKISGCAASPVDKTKGANSFSGSGAFSSTATTAQTAANDLAVGCVVYVGPATESFSGGFVRQQRVDSAALSLAQAIRLLSGTAPVTCSGTETGLTENTPVVITLKSA